MKAKTANNRKAYEQFLVEYPAGEHASDAKKSIEQIDIAEQDDFNKAKSANSKAAYQKFLVDHPSGKYALDAKKSIEQIDFPEQNDYAIAQKADTVEAFEEFLKKHASSQSASKAKKRLDELYVDRDWQAAKKENTVEAYENFIAQHPSASSSSEAKSNIENLRWNETQTLGTADALRSFVTKYPKNKHVEEANAQLRDLTMPALIKAASKDDMGRIRELLSKGSNVNETWEGLTALMYASYNGNLDMVKLLVKSGADVHKGTQRETPLWLADDNYLGKQTDDKKRIVEYLVGKSLMKTGDAKKTVADIPSVDQIRTAIVNAMKAVVGMRKGAIRLFDISYNDLPKKEIKVLCDGAVYDSVAMYELAIASGRIMVPPPDTSADTHAPLAGATNVSFILKKNKSGEWIATFAAK